MAEIKDIWLAEVAYPTDAGAIAAKGNGHAHLPEAESGAKMGAASFMRRQRQSSFGGIVHVLMAFERQVEERFVKLDDARQNRVLKALREGIEDFVTPEKGCRYSDVALLGATSDCQFQAHAMDVSAQCLNGVTLAVVMGQDGS